MSELLRPPGWAGRRAQELGWSGRRASASSCYTELRKVAGSLAGGSCLEIDCRCFLGEKVSPSHAPPSLCADRKLEIRA